MQQSTVRQLGVGKCYFLGEQERQGWSESKEGSQKEEGSRAEDWGHERGQRGKKCGQESRKGQWGRAQGRTGEMTKTRELEKLQDTKGPGVQGSAWSPRARAETTHGSNPGVHAVGRGRT